MSEPSTDEVFADESFEVAVTDRSTQFDGIVWNVVSETFTYNDHPVTREFIDHPGAVAILAMDQDDRILAIQQYRHPIRLRDWEIPAGLLDIAGESTLLAAQRELAEEADLVAATWHLLAEIVTSPGGSNETLRVYLARDLSAASERFVREEEEADIVVRWIGLDEAVNAALSGAVTNVGFTVAVLAAAASRATGWSSLRVAE